MYNTVGASYHSAQRAKIAFEAFPRNCYLQNVSLHFGLGYVFELAARHRRPRPQENFWHSRCRSKMQGLLYRYEYESPGCPQHSTWQMRLLITVSGI